MNAKEFIEYFEKLEKNLSKLKCREYIYLYLKQEYEKFKKDVKDLFFVKFIQEYTCKEERITFAISDNSEKLYFRIDVILKKDLATEIDIQLENQVETIKKNEIKIN